MKKTIFLLFVFGGFLFTIPTVTAQGLILKTGSQLIINSGTTVTVSAGDLKTDGGTITNNGTLNVKEDIINNSGDLFVSTSSGTTNMDGTAAQEITGTSTTKFYGTLNINNSTGVSLTNTLTGNDQEIPGTLNFTLGKLTLNSFNLLIGTTDPTGAGTSAYIVTNNTGVLNRTVAASAVTFPVGNATYNPVILTNAGTSDTYGVVAKDGLPSAFTGTDHAVNRYWDITETTGTGSDLTVNLQWNATEELANFARTYSSMGYTADNGATVAWGTVGAAGGSNPYTFSTAGYTQDLSTAKTFFVADDYYKGYDIDLKVWLAGPYDAVNHDMNNDLNTAGGTLLIPLTDPYGLSTTVPSIHPDIVDWVRVELRQSDRTTIVGSFAKFVNTSGQVVNHDNTNMTVDGIDASYNTYSIATLHRNHFGIVSQAINMDLRSSPSDDLTVLANVYDDASITTPANPVRFLETVSSVDRYGLWDGDATNNGEIAYNGAGNDRIAVLNALSAIPGATLTNVYNANDVNMNRDVSYNGANNDRITILNALGAVPGATYYRHLP